MKKRTVIIFFFFLSMGYFLPGTGLRAQQIAIDRGVRVEGLWCFPLVTDTVQYLFLPDRAFLALDEKKQPQFSFMRYVNNQDNTSTSSEKSITQAGGGGVLHFLVTYDTDEKKIQRAEQQLKQLLGIDEVKLRGPIIFKEGRFALVSSILNPANGRTERNLMAMGAAPVLQGSRIALSFEMDPLHSKLLLESFKMPTPDVSLIFDLAFSGLSDAYNAKLTVDWTEVGKNREIGGGLKVYWVSAEVESIVKELRKTNAIKLEVVGEDAKMENLLNGAYSRITDMLFRKEEPEQASAAEQAAMGGGLNSLFSSGGAFSAEKIFPFGAHFTYKRKDIKTSGMSVLNFNSRTSRDMHHYITFNIGDFYKKYGQDPAYFRTISTDDVDFAQRDIVVGVDGALLPEFDKFINNITVTMKKKHQDSTTTLKEVVITKSILTDNKPVSMNYGSLNDADRVQWLNYEFRAQYNFKGGKNYTAPWVQQNSAMINLFAPYERRVIRIDGDAELLKSKNVRAVSVRIEYPFFGENKIMEMTVKPEENFSEKQFEITLPAGQYTFKYTIRWLMKDGSTVSGSSESDTGILFIDTVPGK